MLYEETEKPADALEYPLPKTSNSEFQINS